jgi:ribosomal protein S7
MDLKNMKGMLKNHRLLEQGNNRVLRWSLWLDGYDFVIIYKLGKKNCVADLLTKEGKDILQQSTRMPEIKMFHKALSSSKPVESAPK